MQMTSACQNAAHAAQSALLAHADHVAISCPQNPRFSFYLFTLGSSGATRTELERKPCEVYCTYVWCLDPHYVFSDNFLLISDHFYAQLIIIWFYLLFGV